MSPTGQRIRLHKYLAEMGVAARRTVERMIAEGRITVNEQPVRSSPCFVTPGADRICIDGRRVASRPPGKVYFLLNKPRGVICTQRDPQQRPRAVDLIPPVGRRVYCVGRLDADSTGLIILTNDGDLTQRLTHPSYSVPKTYVVEIAGQMHPQEMASLKAGLWLDSRRTRPAELRVLRRGPSRSLLQIRLTEGRNREIRRLLARLGHNVRRLKRTAIGPITDRGLKPGSFRKLTPAEISRLRRAAERPPARRKPRS